MSLEHLEQAGITLPRDQWGKRKVHSAVNRPLFLVAAAAAVAAGVLMYWGDGGIATWVGAMLFLLSLFTVTVIALRAVSTQCQETPSGDDAPNRRSERKPQT